MFKLFVKSVIVMMMLSVFFGYLFVDNCEAADTITVKLDGTEDYTSIQAAIDAASPGDTVYVYPGTYYENIVVDKSIFLEGQNRDTTVIDGGTDPGFAVVNISADYVDISGFTLRNYTYDGDYEHYEGVAVFSSYNTIDDNKIISNEWYGMKLYSGSEGNTISNNVINENERGLILISSSNNNVNNNQLNNNDYTGVYLSRVSNNNYFYQNFLEGNDLGFYLSFGNYNDAEIPEDNIIEDNDIVNNNHNGIGMKSTRTSVIDNYIAGNGGTGIDIGLTPVGFDDFNEIINNVIINNGNYGIFIEGSSNNTINNNDITSNNDGACIWLEANNNRYSTYNKISYNTLNGYGVYIDSWANNFNTIDNNIITNNENYSINIRSNFNIIDNNDLSSGIKIAGHNNVIKNNVLDRYGFYMYESTLVDNTLSNNYVNGRPIVLLKDESNTVIDYLAGQVFLVNCDNITVKNQDMDDVFSTIVLYETVDSVFDYNALTALDNHYSFYLYSNSHRNHITNSSIVGGWGGIRLDSSIYNTIKFNSFMDTSQIGLSMTGHTNYVYLNNFINNDIYDAMTNMPGTDYNSTFSFDYSYNGGYYNGHLGNYWGDLVGVDSDGDGIYDSSYDGGGTLNGVDYHPLVMPYSGYVIGGSTPPVNVDPTASFSYTPGSPDVGESVSFNAGGSSDSDGSIVSYSWDLDDDGSFDDASGVSTSYSWSSEGVYSVGLKVVDDDGADDTVTRSVTVSEPVVANDEPTAQAGGPYYAIVGESVSVSASGSSDSDGSIVSYLWDFDNDGYYDDGSGFTETYSWSSVGSFTIGLKVVDDDGDFDTDTASVIISNLPNNPPGKPLISGPVFCEEDVFYTYFFNASDLDDDSLKYYIDWDYGSETVIGYNDSGVRISVNKSWGLCGLYNISCYVYDGSTVSARSYFEVFVEAVPAGDLGYLFDTDSDDIYDGFYSYNDSLSYDVEVDSVSGFYLLDVDDDGTWDYSYDEDTGVLNEYVETEDDESDVGSVGSGNVDDGSGFDLFIPLVIGIIVVMGVFAFILFKKFSKDDQKPVFNSGFNQPVDQSPAEDVVYNDVSQPGFVAVAGDLESAGVSTDMQQVSEEPVEKKKPSDEKPVVPKNFCVDCGTKIRESHKFCVGCGKKIK